jgi:lysyl-tRNA synthetase, class II
VIELEFERGLFALRQEKLNQLAALAQKTYLNQYKTIHTIPEIWARYGEASAETLETERVHVSVAGRLMAIRGQGKAGFAHLQQNGERRFMSARMRLENRGFNSTSCSTWATTSA